LIDILIYPFEGENPLFDLNNLTQKSPVTRVCQLIYRLIKHTVKDNDFNKFYSAQWISTSSIKAWWQQIETTWWPTQLPPKFFKTTRFCWISKSTQRLLKILLKIAQNLVRMNVSWSFYQHFAAVMEKLLPLIRMISVIFYYRLTVLKWLSLKTCSLWFKKSPTKQNSWVIWL